MKKYALLAEDVTYVTAVVSSKTAPAGAIELPLIFDSVQVLHSYLVEGSLEPRPEIQKPTQDASGVHVTGCPEDTWIVVRDLESDEKLAEILTTSADPEAHLDIVDEGAYQIEVIPPLPYIGGVFNYEVTA